MKTNTGIKTRSAKVNANGGAETAVTPKTDPAPSNWAGRVPQLKPGIYDDGLPLHQVEYLCCKMMLKPNHFTSRKSLFAFGKVLKGPAKECGVEFSTKGYSD